MRLARCSLLCDEVLNMGYGYMTLEAIEKSPCLMESLEVCLASSSR